MVFYDEQRPFLWAISIVNTKKLASKNLSYNWIVHKKKFIKKDTPSLFLSNSQNYFSYILSACGVWGARVRIQISKRELHTHIHLDYIKVEIIYCKKKKKKELKPLGLYRDNDINAFYTVFIYKYYKMYSFSSLINTIEAQYSP